MQEELSEKRPLTSKEQEYVDVYLKSVLKSSKFIFTTIVIISICFGVLLIPFMLNAPDSQKFMFQIVFGIIVLAIIFIIIFSNIRVGKIKNMEIEYNACNIKGILKKEIRVGKHGRTHERYYIDNYQIYVPLFWLHDLKINNVVEVEAFYSIADKMMIILSLNKKYSIENSWKSK